MDWNVFFSTVSQTSGAIVGIFAAFLITKIVANQSEYSKNIDKAADAITKSKALIHESKIRYFKWYNERVEEHELGKIDDLFDESNGSMSVEGYYEKLNFSPFQERGEVLDKIDVRVKQLISYKQEEFNLRKRFSMPTNVPVRQNFLNAMQILSNNVIEERELIDNLLVRTKVQAESNRQLVASLKRNSESSSLISMSIMAVILLFFAGVIYPLSFLPIEPNTEIRLSVKAFWDILYSLKGMLLTIISLIFCGLMGVFLFINSGLRYRSDTIALLSKYSNISNYSEYFKKYSDSSGDQSDTDEAKI